LSIALLVLAGGASVPAGAQTSSPIQIYGVWHCGDDYCTWSTVRSIAEFDEKNHWIIDAGDGNPSVNLVVLAFVDPLKLLSKTNDSQSPGGWAAREPLIARLPDISNLRGTRHFYFAAT
jgi:hypothetical protein